MVTCNGAVVLVERQGTLKHNINETISVDSTLPLNSISINLIPAVNFQWLNRERTIRFDNDE